MNYLLDTNVISELISKQPAAQVTAWVESVDQESIFLSVITMGELKKGVEKLPESSRKNQLNAWLEQDLLIRFQDQIISLDLPVLLTWGTMYAELERKGNPLPAIDSLLAASALRHGLTLVTRNTADFEPAEIPLHNPWLG